MQRTRFGQLFLPFSPRLFIPVAMALVTAAPVSIAQQQSNSPSNSQDVPHQTPGTNNPDVAKQRRPDQGSAPGTTTPPKDPTQNNPDVPRQEPGTNNPDVAKQRQTDSGTSTASATGKSKKKAKRRQSKAPGGTTA